MSRPVGDELLAEHGSATDRMDAVGGDDHVRVDLFAVRELDHARLGVLSTSQLCVSALDSRA